MGKAYIVATGKSIADEEHIEHSVYMVYRALSEELYKDRVQLVILWDKDNVSETVILGRRTSNEPIPIRARTVDSDYRSYWSFVDTLNNEERPELVVSVGYPKDLWFVPVSPEGKKVEYTTVAYYYSDTKTINRYLRVAGRPKGERVDLKYSIELYDLVIPASELAYIAIAKDVFLSYAKNVAEPLLVPLPKVEVSTEKAKEYRAKVAISDDCYVWFFQGANVYKNKIDQLLCYFNFFLLRRPCDRLVMHTNLEGDYDIEAISARLGILRNVRVLESYDFASLEGALSTCEEYIGLPCACSHNIPAFLAAKLSKTVTYSSVGLPGLLLPKCKDTKLVLLDAPVPTFPLGEGNDVYYLLESKPKTSFSGRVKAASTVDEVFGNEDSWKSSFLESINKIVSGRKP